MRHYERPIRAHKFVASKPEPTRVIYLSPSFAKLSRSNQICLAPLKISIRTISRVFFAWGHTDRIHCEIGKSISNCRYNLKLPLQMELSLSNNFGFLKNATTPGAMRATLVVIASETEFRANFSARETNPIP